MLPLRLPHVWPPRLRCGLAQLQQHCLRAAGAAGAARRLGAVQDALPAALRACGDLEVWSYSFIDAPFLMALLPFWLLFAS